MRAQYPYCKNMNHKLYNIYAPDIGTYIVLYYHSDLLECLMDICKSYNAKLTIYGIVQEHHILDYGFNFHHNTTYWLTFGALCCVYIPDHDTLTVALRASTINAI